MTALVVSSLAFAGKPDVWRQESTSAFAKGHKERVVVSDAGRVRLGRAVQPTEPIDAAHVWALARTASGVVYAATGNAGKVYRRENDAPWALAYDAEDTQVLSLAVLPDGRVMAGTGPGGQVVDVSDPKHPSSRPDPTVQYVWGLAADAAGNLYAATGPTGQLWKRNAEGHWSLLLDSKHPHLLCVAAAPDGSVYAGSDGDGIIYRVSADGKVSVVYDAPQNEIRTLLVEPDGTLYAGTAAEAGGGSGGGPSRGLASTADAAQASGGAGPLRAATPAQVRGTAPTPIVPPAAGGTATPRPVVPGDNAVYRIANDGAAREIFRARTMIYALAWQADRLLIGTGPEGQLYEVRELGRETAPIARLDHGEILSLLPEPRGGLLIGAGDPGGVLRLAAGYTATGTLTSEVHDTKLISRFGALTWTADRPAGTSITVQLRTGNVGEPDASWSGWSAPQTDPAAARAHVGPARFAQYRATFKTDEPTATPELRSIAVYYQTLNLAPELSRIDVPDARDADGSPRPARLTLKWEASDPNGDELSYTIQIRKDGWPDWVRLGSEPVTEKTFSWDTAATPAGMYRVRVTASDRPSNAPDEALTRDLTSEPFLIDHQAPSVTLTAKGKVVTVTLKDGLTRLVKAAYALDGGDWTAVFPADGLFDTQTETITIPLDDLKAGTHVLVVRATDAAGNVGSGDAVVVVP